MPWLIQRSDDCYPLAETPVCIVRDERHADALVEEGDAASARNEPLWTDYCRRLWEARHIDGSAFRRGSPLVNEPAYPVPEPELVKLEWDATIPKGQTYSAVEVPELAPPPPAARP